MWMIAADDRAVCIDSSAVRFPFTACVPARLVFTQEGQVTRYEGESLRNEHLGDVTRA